MKAGELARNWKGKLAGNREMGGMRILTNVVSAMCVSSLLIKFTQTCSVMACGCQDFAGGEN